MAGSRDVPYGVAIVVVPIVTAIGTSFAALAVYDAVWGDEFDDLTPSVIGGITAFVTWLAVTIIMFKRVSPTNGDTWPFLPERNPQRPSDAWAKGLGWPPVSTGGADRLGAVIHDPAADGSEERPSS